MNTPDSSVLAAASAEESGVFIVDHSAVVTLLNRRGQRVALFTPPYEVAPVAADLHNVADRL